MDGMVSLMGAQPLSDELAQAAADAYAAHGNNAAQAAEALGLKPSTFDNRLKVAAGRGMLGTKPVLPGFVISKTTAVTNEDGDVVREFVQQRPEPGEQFQVPEGHRVKGVSALVNADGRVTQQWVKTREGDLDPLYVAEAIKKAFEGYEPAAPVLPGPTEWHADRLTLIPLADLHLGMFAWGLETLVNWDLKIAEEVIGNSIEALLARTKPSAEAIILGGGDLIHSDNNENRTARSHNALQVDGRYDKIIGVACRLLVRVGDAALRRHSRVVFRVLKGNHDEHASVAVAYFLLAWYRNEPRVTVDVSPSLFWNYRFGNVMLAATHGHEVKINKMPGVMAQTWPEDWGATKHRFAHGFHVHHTSKDEDGGVVWETHQAPVPPDGWHYGQGYNSGRSFQAIEYHNRFGEVGRVREVILDAEAA